LWKFRFFPEIEIKIIKEKIIILNQIIDE